MKKNQSHIIKITIALVCSLLQLPGMAQTSTLGTYNGVWFSGSGYGLLYNPALFLTKKRTTMTFGPNIQINKGEIIGVQATGEFTASATPRGEIFFYASAQYQFKGSITIKERYTYKPEISQHDKDAEQYHTTEFYTGFGVKHHLMKNLFLDWSAGVGWYNTKGNDQYYSNRKGDYERIRMDRDLSLHLRVGLQYRLVKRNTSNFKPYEKDTRGLLTK